MNEPLTRLVKILIAAASLMLLAVYFFPLWNFDFDVPQYPEGLSMQIWINKIGGQLDQINGLNHYVGMRAIDASSFPELVIFPWITAALIAIGLLTVFVNRGWMLTIWFVLFAAFAAFGMADFYRWMFDYGHQLDPRAPIKMEPFTPPIFGENQIMNFLIIARPAGAGVVMMVSFAVAVIAHVLQIWHVHKPRHRSDAT